MVGVSRITSCTVARSSSLRRATNCVIARVPTPAARVASTRLTMRIALLGAAHRLDHVAEEGRMQIAEEADEAAIRFARAAAPRTSRGLALRFGFTGVAVLVARLEVAAVQREMRRVLARQDGVGLRAGRHQNACARAARVSPADCSSLLRVGPAARPRADRWHDRTRRPPPPAGSGPRRSGCLPPAPSPLPRG